MYKLTNTQSILRISDGASIPNDPSNNDYADYLAYVKKGGVVAPVDVPTLSQNVAALTSKIKSDANRIIFDTIGSLGNEYTAAKADADAFKAAGYLGAVPSSVSSWAAAKGWTATQACDDILLAAANWIGAQSSIRSNRLARTEQAKVCTTQAALDAVAAQWAGFNAAIRTQLGV